MTHHFFHNHFLVRQVRIRPRLFISGLVGLCTIFLLPHSIASHDITRLLIGWNVGACLYLLLCGVMISTSTHDVIRRRAR